MNRIKVSMMYQDQRDGIYRERILEQFLPISKQTPKPSTPIECKDVMSVFKKSKF